MKKKASSIYVAIGSSAGGFEALSELVASLPPKSGFFYFLAQHCAKGENSMLAGLLGRKSSIEVQSIECGTLFKPDILYILPSELEIYIQNNKPSVREVVTDTPFPFPNIDILFKTLCTIKNSKIVAVLLSGSGSDGTSGMQAVKNNNGITVVQHPQEAMFAHMPQSAIEAKVVDYILRVKDIAQMLIKFAHAVNEGTYYTEDIPFDEIRKLLRTEKQLDLFKYKDETVLRRIQKRIEFLNLENLEAYAGYIKKNKKEIEILNREVLIGVTEFFRGEEAFEALQAKLRINLKIQKEFSEFRIWCVACSSGEEAYSLAILVNEISQELDKKINIKIFATDIDDIALEKARKGEYSKENLQNVKPEWLQKYFTPTPYGYEVIKSLREQMVFAHHNFLHNPPFINMNLISCRNVLIYLIHSVQNEVFSLFHFSLNKDGLLFLGPSESTASCTNYFLTIDNKYKIYEKKEEVYLSKFPQHSIDKYQKKLSPSRGERMKTVNVEKIEESLKNTMFEYYKNACLIIDRDYTIVYKKGNIPYLNYSDGIVSLNLFMNLDKRLHYDIRMLLNHVFVSKKLERTKFIQLESKKEEVLLRIVAQPFEFESTTSMILMSFEEISSDDIQFTGSSLASMNENKIIHTLSVQLNESRDEIQSMFDELLFSKQNMSMINSELQESNEKLQSTVEELETSNEELQSSNEELHASLSSNRELQNKLSLLLESSIEGILGLDIFSRHIFVNKKAAKMLGYSAEYLLGKTSHAIWHHTKEDGSYYPEEECPINEVIKTGKESRGEDYFWNKEGRGFHVEYVRSPIMEDGQITGVVMFFHDISEKKELEKKVENEHQLLTSYLEVSGLLIMVLDTKSTIVSINNTGSKLLGLSKEKLIGLNWFDNFIDKKLLKETRKVFVSLLKKKETAHYINEIIDAKGNKHLISWNNVRQTDSAGNVIGIIATGNDITKEKALSEKLNESHIKYETTFKAAQIGIAHVSADGSWLEVNEYFCRLVGYTKAELLKLTFQDITHPDDLSKDLNYVKQLIAGEKDTYSMEKRYIKKNGNIIWIHLSVVLIRDSNHNPLYFISIIQDISQIKLLMLELESKKNEFENIIRFAPNPIMLHSEDGTVLMVNESWEELSGYSIKDIPTIEAWHKQTSLAEKSLDVDKLFENGTRVDEGNISVTTKDGRELIWIFSYAPLGNIYSGMRIIVSSAMDITDMHKKEELMLAQSRQAAMGDMIGMIAHQWRQPLAVIGMVANNLKAQLELEEEITPEDIIKLTDVLMEQTQYLSHTIDDFRTFFKPEKTREIISLCKIYEKLESMIHKIMENNQVEIHFINSCDIELYTFPNELIQVLINLFNNAKDAMKEKKVKNAKIDVITRVTSEILTIDVIDNAGGIDKSVITKLGEPYVTTKSQNGTGLGIYMSMIILQKHFSGNLKWKNIKDGSCFTIEIPLENTNIEEETAWVH
ncbi:PAS domain S-box protein [bacterium]|nr:PAS domain S-box protein [bacterium]MBU1990396.1 PAS domain S-box protein [bacterium]